MKFPSWLNKENLAKYWPAIAGILVAAVSICISVDIANTTETEENSRFEAYRDSISAVRHSDSISYEQKIESVHAQLETTLAERDSIARKVSTNTNTEKVVYRTIYKDSVREVITENTATASVYEERITQVRDSLNKIIAEKDGVEIKYVERIVHDTIVTVVNTTDSVSVVKTTEKKSGPIGLYASGEAAYGTGGFRYDADAGIKYYIVGPLYGKAGVRYDGDISGAVGLGIDIRF